MRCCVAVDVLSACFTAQANLRRELASAPGLLPQAPVSRRQGDVSAQSADMRGTSGGDAAKKPQYASAYTVSSVVDTISTQFKAMRNDVFRRQQNELVSLVASSELLLAMAL